MKMENFTKELTIIDFLGILLPGAYLVLLLNGIIPIAALWEDYFGPKCGDGVKAVFLIVIGYVVGSLLHEAAELLEKIIQKCCPCLNARMRVYKQVFQSEKDLKKSSLKSWKAEAENEQNSGQKDEKNGGQETENDSEKCAKEDIEGRIDDILTQVAYIASYRKRNIFEGFHVMMRNLFVVCVVAGLIDLAIPLPFYQKVRDTIPGIVAIMVFGALLALMAWRSWHYSLLRYKYAFEDYKNLQNGVNAVKEIPDFSLKPAGGNR